MPDDSDMNADRARAILELKFSQQDIARMNWLTLKNKDGELTPAEQDEIAGYMRVGHFLELMQSKARQFLRGQNENG
ncbi:MAG TPA: hypothetical protein VND64_07095 [Pirellulales bacterium]|nr:hypothetical protein [Pirellulales bacterium]